MPQSVWRFHAAPSDLSDLSGECIPANALGIHSGPSAAQHVSAVERGTRPAKIDYLQAVDNEFGTSLAVFYESFVMQDLAPVWLRSWLEYEEKAIALRLYGALVIPGLFQTERYARMVLSCAALQPPEIERRVQLRLSRQAILDRDEPPRISAVIEELTIRRGTAEVMSDQIQRLIELTDRPNITIRVIPIDAPRIPAGVDHWNSRGSLT